MMTQVTDTYMCHMATNMRVAELELIGEISTMTFGPLQTNFPFTNTLDREKLTVKFVPFT